MGLSVPDQLPGVTRHTDGRDRLVLSRVVPVAAGSLAYGLAVVAVFDAPSVAATALAMVAVGVLGALVAPARMALVGGLAATDRRHDHGGQRFARSGVTEARGPRRLLRGGSVSRIRPANRFRRSGPLRTAVALPCNY